ncbi:MAG: hypothetical protein PHT99_09390, partial [Methanoregula sp.]|nr:hypothetical protein [Methanoregula sp.]
AEGKTGGATVPDLPAPELLMPSLDDMGEAPADEAPGPDAFSDLGGSSSMDDEFGDLDNLSLDDIEPDDMEAGGTMADVPAEAPPDEAPAPAAPAPAESSAIKTAWIPSDAPKGAERAEDQIGVQSDMASFAGGEGGGADEDLLSSIASDVKHVKKEMDVSLLRELKDFRAPAAEIDSELTTLYQKLSSCQKPKDKTQPPEKGIK